MIFPILAAAVAFAAAQPPPPATSLVWPLHGSDGAGGIGGWASSEIPVGAQLPFCVLRLGAGEFKIDFR
jgi:hypothetical protein